MCRNQKHLILNFRYQNVNKLGAPCLIIEFIEFYQVKMNLNEDINLFIIDIVNLPLLSAHLWGLSWWLVAVNKCMNLYCVCCRIVLSV